MQTNEEVHQMAGAPAALYLPHTHTSKRFLTKQKFMKEDENEMK